MKLNTLIKLAAVLTLLICNTVYADDGYDSSGGGPTPGQGGLIRANSAALVFLHSKNDSEMAESDCKRLSATAKQVLAGIQNDPEALQLGFTIVDCVGFVSRGGYDTKESAEVKLEEAKAAIAKAKQRQIELSEAIEKSVVEYCRRQHNASIEKQISYKGVCSNGEQGILACEPKGGAQALLVKEVVREDTPRSDKKYYLSPVGRPDNGKDMYLEYPYLNDITPQEMNVYSCRPQQN